MTNTPTVPSEIFYSYAHEDGWLLEILEKHLSGLRREGLITSWHDRKISAGMDWEHTIDEHLNRASVILLLVSPDFMDSDYCYGIEMGRAMERHAAGSARVIPIILRPVDWQHAPFARLQALPTEGRPITTWEERDEAFLDVATGMRKVIESLVTRATDSDITRFPGRPTSYFEPLENYLKEASRHRFPSQSDFAQDLIYLPEPYVVRLRTLLEGKQRVLLVGPSAAGKSVLALAFGKHLQDTEHYSVVYKNAARAREGEGSLWHELVLAHDRPGTLYILDNCHLATEEVNEFCFQWEGKPPEYAQCILISRPEAEEAETHLETMRDYFESGRNETIEVYPQDFYRGILEKYATAYQRQDPTRYAALEDDVAELLQKQHAHNLVISKSRLDTWRSLGGKLSTVREEAVYQALKEKYLVSSRVALPTLCALRQYEIPAHNLFVEAKLPQEEVEHLQQEKLLTSRTVQNYGVLYDLRFHPAEAREIFKAHIYRKYGQVNTKQLAEATASILQDYLSARPANYLAVYQALHEDAWRQKQKVLLEHLMTNPELQECAAYHFETGSIEDTLRYIYRLARFEPARAHVLIAAVMRDIGIESMCTKIVGHPLQNIGVMLDCLYQIDAEVARQVVDKLDMQRLADTAGTQSLQSLFRLVRVFNSILPSRGQAFLACIALETWVRQATANNIVSMLTNIQKYNPTFQRKQLVATLDMNQLMQQSERASISLQRLSALIRLLKASSQIQARTLLEHIPMYILVQKANQSSIVSVEQIIGYMQEFDYSPGAIEGFVEALDVEQLVQRAETENLQHLYWLLRAFKRIVPVKVHEILEKLTPDDLATLCCTKEANVTQIQQFVKVLPKPFSSNFLRKFSARDIALACNRSSLGTVGAFVQHEYMYIEQGYALFQEQFLKERLSREPLNEIGKFLHRVRKIAGRGIILGRNALALLIDTDLGERVGKADLEAYGMLLHNARTIDKRAVGQLLAPLQNVRTLQSALEKSSIHSIQIFIYDVAASGTDVDLSALQSMRQALQSISLAEKLARAALKDIRHFLWNVYVHIDPVLAQEYCKLVDSQPRPVELATTTLDELFHFLWNLISISTLPTFATLDMPILRQRLLQAWSSQMGHGATLLGIIAIVQTATWEAGTFQKLAEEAGQQEQIASYLWSCLNERRPYILALTLLGLRVYNEEIARAIVRLHMPIDRVLKIMSATRSDAKTERSITLVDEILEWLTRVRRD